MNYTIKYFKNKEADNICDDIIADTQEKAEEPQTSYIDRLEYAIKDLADMLEEILKTDDSNMNKLIRSLQEARVNGK